MDFLTNLHFHNKNAIIRVSLFAWKIFRQFPSFTQNTSESSCQRTKIAPLCQFVKVNPGKHLMTFSKDFGFPKN